MRGAGDGGGGELVAGDGPAGDIAEEFFNPQPYRYSELTQSNVT